MAKWLSKADTGADAVLRWAGVIGLMIAAYTWLASELPWFGQIGLAEMIALAIPAALLTLLAITTSLALYRFFRPLSSPSESSSAPNPHESINTRVKQSVSDLRRRVEEVNTALLETIQANDRKARERHEPLQANYTAILRDYQNMRGLEAKLTEKLDALREADRDAANQLSTLFMALQAIFARERLNELHDLIRAKVSELTQTIDAGEAMNEDDWRLWQIGENEWDRMMGYWCEISDRYNPEARRRILHTEPSDYVGSRWQNVRRELFPGDDQLHLYKTLVIQYHNWIRAEGDILSRVHFCAFGGPSATQVLSDVSNPVPETVSLQERIGDDYKV